MKKILLSCVTCLLALGLVTACNNEDEEPNEPEASDTGDDSGTQSGGSTETGTVFGFEVEGVMNYIDGGLVEYNGTLQSYEGSVTTNISDAVRITVEESDVTGAYYLSFDNEGATNWITIVENGTHINLSYSTEKALIYYNAEYGCWGTSDLAYFLCYNSAFECLYCSALSEYGPTSEKSSPIAALYDAADGKLVTGLNGYTYIAPAPTEITISGLSYVLVDGTTQLTATVDAGADPSVTWEIALPENATEGEVVSTYASINENGVVTGLAAHEGLVVTATSTVDTEVSDSFTINVVAVTAPTTTGEADTTYKLGALTDSASYVWFTGNTTGNTFLEIGDSYDTAAEVYVTGQTIPNVENACTLSIVSEENLVYISNNGSTTSVTLSSSPCIWVWNEDLEVFAQGSSEGRVLVYYADTPSFRGYAQNESNLARPHVAAYLEEPKIPDPESITISGEQEVCVGFTIQLEATVEPANAVQSVTWSTEDTEHITIDQSTGVVTGVKVTEAEQPVTITATSTEVEEVSQTYEITVGTTLNYSYTFKNGDLGANSTGTTGERGTAAGTSESLGGLKWSYSAALYKGWSGGDNGKGIQIGAGNSQEAQTTTPFTISTTFSENVKLSEITLKLGVASDGGGKYSISLDSNAVATDVEFTTAAVTDYTHSGLSVEGEELTISLLSTKEKAMYIQGISFTVEFLGTSSGENPE